MTTKKFLAELDRLDIPYREDQDKDDKHRVIIYNDGVTLVVLYPDDYSISWKFNLREIYQYEDKDTLIELLCKYDLRDPRDRW